MRYHLTKEGFEVDVVNSGKEALEKVKTYRPNLILLDVMMPEMDGIETCRELKALPEIKDTVIAFLTARNEDYSQIAGFDVGADDFISKPIKPRVLVSRIKGLLRRVGANGSEETTRIGDLVIDREKYSVTYQGQELVFPRKEFELLSLLISKPGKVFTRDEILDRVWGNEVVVGDRTIDVHVRKLREKLGEDTIKTVKGIGYKFDF